MAKLIGSDPTGSGQNEQKVNSKGEALTAAVTETLFERSSEDRKAFNWSSGIIDVDATDTVLLLKNTSDIPLHVESITIWNGSTASQYQVHLPITEVTTPTGTAVAGTNLNVGNPDVTDAIAKSDESTNTQGTLIFTPMMAIDSDAVINTVGLILPKNKSVGIDVVDETTESGVTIRAHY